MLLGPGLASEWPLNSQGAWPHSLTSFWEVWPLVWASILICYSWSRKHTNLLKLPVQGWVGLRMTSDLTKSITSKFDLFLRGLTSRFWPLYRPTKVVTENTQTCQNCLDWPQNDLWPHKEHEHTNLPKLPGQALVGLRMTSDLTSSIISKFDLILRGLNYRSWPLYWSTTVEAENTQTCLNCLGRAGLASEWPLTSQEAWPPSITSFWEVLPHVADLYVNLL